jgi:anti-anti-sigma factor
MPMGDTGLYPTDGWSGHLLLLHESEQVRRSAVAAWVRDGLDHGEKIVYSEPPTYPPQLTLRRLLHEHGVDASAALAGGRLTVLPPAEFYQSLPDVVEQALAAGYPAVRTSGRTEVALTGMSRPAYVAVEQRIEDLRRSHPYSALCQYDRGTTTGSWLAEAAALHLLGIRETHLHTADGTGALRLAGTVDATNDDVLAAVLRSAAAAAAGGVLRLDLGGLTYLGVGGCRALVDSTREFRTEGGEVRVIAVSGAVRRLFGLLDLDRHLTIAPDGTAR